HSEIVQDPSSNITKKDWAHLGSGVDAVNSVLEFIPNCNDNGSTKLTALEAFAIACAHTTTVSRKFDYYIHATGEYKQSEEF
ncbi:hypothetical protein, partial [Klebsiella pneumoniae]|uniref:hypothetical protein n=1 Tax=Klebsiella pneumoniae TaxID=573 RepID=UPI0039682F54